MNRSDVPLVVDTGAGRTVLATSTVANLLLAHSQHEVTRLRGLGGTVSNADVYADIQLGGASFNARLAEASLPDIGGLVGGDMLSDYDVEFDLPHHRLKLWRESGSCGAADLPWTGPRATIPINVIGGEQVRVPVTIDGKTLDAMLDSGAGLSILRADAAQRLGVTGASLAGDPDITVRGVGSGVVGVRMHRFDAVTVGAMPIGAVPIAVGEAEFGSADMLLGLDFLRARRVWLSYRIGLLFVQ